MAMYKIEQSNTGFESRSEMAIEVQDDLIREYTTVVNAGIAKVLAKAAVLLIEAENDGNVKQLLERGLALSVE